MTYYDDSTAYITAWEAHAILGLSQTTIYGEYIEGVDGSNFGHDRQTYNPRELEQILIHPKGLMRILKARKRASRYRYYEDGETVAKIEEALRELRRRKNLI